MKNIWILYDKEKDKFSLEKGVSFDNIKLNDPLSIWWLITWNCNLNCLHCYGNKEELPDKELDNKNIMIVASKIINSWIKRISISWWEPTIKKDLFNVIEYLCDNWLSVILSTNWLLIKDNIDKLKKMRHIEISLDGSSDQIHETFRPTKLKEKNISFRNAINGLKTSIQNWLLTRALTTLNIYNKEDLFWIWQLLSDIWVQEWHIWRVVNAGRARFIYHKLNNFDFDYEIINELQKTFPNIKIQFNYPSKSSNYYALILPNWYITTQNNVTWEKIELGSLLKHDIWDFWNNKNFNKQWHLRKWLNMK